MSKITYSNKQTGDEIGSSVFNEIKTVVNANDDNKAPLVSGTVPVENLPVFEIQSGTGITLEVGTNANSIKINSIASNLTAMFKALPGYVEGGGPQIPQIQDGVITMVDLPTGGGTAPETLGATTLAAGTPGANSISYSWTSVTDSTAYTLQLSTSNTFTSPIVSSYTGLTGTPTGLTANTTYYARIRATASGFTSGPWSSTVTSLTDGAGNITPPAPTAAVVDDTADKMTFTRATGYNSNTDYEYSLDGGTTIVQLTSTNPEVLVGNVAKAIGQVRVRVKAATGRNASAWLSNGTAFTVATGSGTTVDLSWTSSDLVGASKIWTKASGPHSPYSPTLGQISGPFRMWMKSDNVDSNFIMGFDPNPNVGYQGMDAAIQLSYFQGSQRLFAWGTGIEGTNANITASGNVTVGYVGLYRDSTGVIKVQQSTNGATWTDLYTFPELSAGSLYISMSMDGGGKIYEPKVTTF